MQPREIIEYEVVYKYEKQAETIELDEHVMRYIRDGYQPYGSPVWDRERDELCQAMVRYNPD